ncbi:MAG: hypothetical protein ACRENU_00630 [Gemmatimonadaceae bacterium]
MTRSLFFALALSLASTEAARAQILEGPGRGGFSREPIAWTSLSIGWLGHGGLCDQETNACWDFGSAPQWRGTLEFPVGRGATIGAAASIARVPLVYNGGILGNSCSGCDADANVAQYFGNFRIGGGTGLHQIIDVNAGVTVFSNFRSTNGTRLGGKALTDLSFLLGYGFGYSLNPRTQIMLVQDFGLVIHQRQTGNSERTAQQQATRIGIRVGLGEGRR